MSTWSYLHSSVSASGLFGGSGGTPPPFVPSLASTFISGIRASEEDLIITNVVENPDIGDGRAGYALLTVQNPFLDPSIDATARLSINDTVNVGGLDGDMGLQLNSESFFIKDHQVIAKSSNQVILSNVLGEYDLTGISYSGGTLTSPGVIENNGILYNIGATTDGVYPFGDVPYTSCAYAPQGEFYAAGHSNYGPSFPPGGFNGPTLTKHGADGTILWKNYYDKNPTGLSGDYRSEKIALDQDGFIYLLSFGGQSPNGIVLFKIEPTAGQIVWQKLIPGDVVVSAQYVVDMTVDNNGDILFVGRTRANNTRISAFSDEGTDLMVAKFDSDGNEVFIKGYYLDNSRSSGWNVGGIATDYNNNIYVTGQVNDVFDINTDNPDSQVFGTIIKFNPDMTEILWQQYGEQYNDGVFWSDVDTSGDNQHIYVCERRPSRNFQYITKINADTGAFVWSNAPAPTNSSGFYRNYQLTSIYVDPYTEQVYCGGYVFNYDGNTTRASVIIIEVDTDTGLFKWGQTFGETGQNNFLWYAQGRGDVVKSGGFVGTAFWVARSAADDGVAITVAADGSTPAQSLDYPARSQFPSEAEFRPSSDILITDMNMTDFDILGDWLTATNNPADPLFTNWFDDGIIEQNHRLSGTAVDTSFTVREMTCRVRSAGYS